jgi:hypothetical protein
LNYYFTIVCAGICITYDECNLFLFEKDVCVLWAFSTGVKSSGNFGSVLGFVLEEHHQHSNNITTTTTTTPPPPTTTTTATTTPEATTK